MSDKRIVSVKGLHEFQFKPDDSLLLQIRKIESTLIAAGAKPGEDYTVMDLVGIAQTQMKIAAFDKIAETIKTSFYDEYGQSVADVIRKGLMHNSGSYGLADSIDIMADAMRDIAANPRR